MTDDRPLWQRLGADNISDAALFHEFGDIPATPAVIRVVRRPIAPGASYEEAHWAELSPVFRAAHNRLRRMRGLSAIPEPAIDRYVPRRAAIRPIDMNDREMRAAVREFIGTPLLGARGDEGFTINGEAPERRPAPPRPERESAGLRGNDEGFTINGRSVRRR